jgi:hypothetical protein
MMTPFHQLDLKTILEPSSGDAPVFPRARICAAEALLREHAAEIVAAVVRHAEAGDRAAMRLARKHGLPIWPAPDVLAARLAESIERTRATVATLLAEGGLAVGKTPVSATRSALAHPAGAHVIAFSDVKTRRRIDTLGCRATKTAGALVNNNENTSAAADGEADV